MMENYKIKNFAISMLDMGENEMKFENPLGAAYALGAYSAYRTVYKQLTGIDLDQFGRIQAKHSKLSEYVDDNANL